MKSLALVLLASLVSFRAGAAEFYPATATVTGGVELKTRAGETTSLQNGTVSFAFDTFSLFKHPVLKMRGNSLFRLSTPQGEVQFLVPNGQKEDEIYSSADVSGQNVIISGKRATSDLQTSDFEQRIGCTYYMPMPQLNTTCDGKTCTTSTTIVMQPFSGNQMAALRKQNWIENWIFEIKSESGGSVLIESRPLPKERTDVTKYLSSCG